MVSNKLIEFIKGLEGYRPQPYLDTAGVPTIGYGTTVYPNGTRVTMRDKSASIQDAVSYLVSHLQRDWNTWFPSVANANLNQNQLDALADFAYNLGTGALLQSTLLKKIIANPSDPNITFQFDRWVYDQRGNKLPGLVSRRAWEASLYFS